MKRSENEVKLILCRRPTTTLNSIPIFSLRMERLDWMSLLRAVRQASGDWAMNEMSWSTERCKGWIEWKQLSFASFFCGLVAAAAAMLRNEEANNNNHSMNESTIEEWVNQSISSWAAVFDLTKLMKRQSGKSWLMNGANKAKSIISFTSIVIEMLIVAALAPLLFSSSFLFFIEGQTGSQPLHFNFINQ